jgi:hypothetical protein
VLIIALPTKPSLTPQALLQNCINLASITPSFVYAAHRQAVALLYNVPFESTQTYAFPVPAKEVTFKPCGSLTVTGAELGVLIV